MPEEQKQGAKPADELKDAQNALKTQVKALEESLKSPAKTGFLQAEMREMLQNLVLQNKRLGEKMDYLINLLVEAASDQESEVYDKTLAALANAQAESLDQLALLKQRVDEASKTEVASDAAEAQRASALEQQVRQSSASVEEKFKQLADAVAGLSVNKQLEVLEQDLQSLRAQMASVEKTSGVPPSLEQNINFLKASVAGVQSELGTLASVVQEVRGEEKKLLDLEIGLKKLEAELAEKTIRQYTGGLPEEDRKRLEELASKVLALSGEVTRLEQELKTLPTSEAQQFSAVTRKLDQVETELKKVEDLETAPDFKNAVIQQLAEFRARLDGLASAVEKVSKAVEKPEDPIETFLTKLPPGKPVTVSEIASGLNLPEQEVLYKLAFMEKAKPGFLQLHNADFLSKVSRKKPFLTRL